MPEHDIWRALCFAITLGFLCLVAWGVSRADEALASKPQEQLIFRGCAYKSELTFAAAQERIYNHGDTQRLLAYIQHEMSEAEFALQAPIMEQIGHWVDSHRYATAHDYARALFYECVNASYAHFGITPTDSAAAMMQRFEQQLESTEEQMLPNDIEQEYSA